MVAVGFDFDHTLGLDNGLERKAFGRLAAELRLPLDLEQHDGRALVEGVLTRFRGGELTLDEAVATFLTALSSSADVFTAAEHYREVCYGLVDELVVPVDGAREVLAALAADGVRCAILTNGWSPLQQRKIERALGEFPGPILVSGALGVAKPDDAAFALLAAALEHPREAIFYVGDDPRNDVFGARGARMRPVWFDWEGRTFPAEIAAAEQRIGHLSELLGIVRGSRG